MNNFNVSGLFPTPVASFDLSRPFKKEELEFIKSVELRPAWGNKVSANDYILNSFALQEIQTFCDQSVNCFLKEVLLVENCDLYITQSWLNFTKPGESHPQHTHTNSICSGVLYIQVDENLDGIFFHKEEKYERIKLNVPNYHTNKFNHFNTPLCWFPAKVGTLYIFDSSLSHSVPETKSSELRISLSFNTFLKSGSKVGDLRTLTELKL